MNPVSKARQISDHLTQDIFLANKLLEIITYNLTAEEIDDIWYELRLNLNALNDD